MNTEKILEVARKLAELAARGVDGEAVNAQAKLDELLRKHKLTLDDLGREVRKWYYVCYAGANDQLVCHIWEDIVGAAAYNAGRCPAHQLVDTGTTRRRKVLVVNCTALEHIQLLEMLDHYTAELKRAVKELKRKAVAQKKEIDTQLASDLKHAMWAMICRHRLGHSDIKATPPASFTKDDLRTAAHRAELASRLGTHGYNRADKLADSSTLQLPASL